MHIQKVIEQFGYKPNEAKVYLAALGLGEATVSEIAGRVKMPRTSVQIIAEALHKNGLMNFYIKRRYKYWIAENPEKLLIRLREQEAALRAVLPELQAARRDKSGRPTVKVFIGEEEIKLILDDIIATKHHILAIISWDDWISFFGSEYVNDFINLRKSHFLRIRLLTPKTPSALKLMPRDEKELRERRFLPENLRIKNVNFIYGNKTALISLEKHRPTGVLIEDEDIKNTMTIFFECLWNQSYA